MSTSTGKSLERSREVRLGLVMYGGVSLAIYINGVAHEFFRAVRGRGVYRLIKALTDSDIAVDIISGTSAGGINGILLGYALCNEREFGDCSVLWRMHGDIRRLLRSPSASPEATPSLLDSEHYYQEKLEDALRSMGPCPPDEPASPYYTPLKELDLFITGTDVDGNVYTTVDDEGHLIDVKDHRSVFILKHRKGRKEPFNPASGAGADPEATHRALAKLARITSCFPAAFSPVEVEGPGVWPEDDMLQLWGMLTRKAFFLDGGVLDNKPFTYTIREIYYRMADREVERKLFYVEPDPERFKPPADPIRPNILQAVVRSLISIPSYESIADDLRLLEEHNGRIHRFQRFVQCIDPHKNEAGVSQETMDFITLMRSWEEEYPERQAAYEKEAANPHGKKPKDGCAYEKARLMDLSERVIRGVIGLGVQQRVFTEEERMAAGQLYRAFDRAPRAGDGILYNFDISFRLRRLFHLLYACPSPRIGEDMEKSPKRRAQYDIGRQIAVLEILESAMGYLLQTVPFDWQHKEPVDLWADIEAAFCLLLNAQGDAGPILPPGCRENWLTARPAEWHTQDQLTLFKGQLFERIEKIARMASQGALQPPPRGAFESMLWHTDRCEQGMFRFHALKLDKEEEPLPAFEDFIFLDAQTFPFELVCGLREKDIIETVRISPLDAQRGFSNRKASEKISGDELHHFGGFFKRSWRSNDILWGRLDGLCQLVESLLKPDRVRMVLDNPSLRKTLRESLLSRGAYSLDPAEIFPHAGEATHLRLKAWLEDLVSEEEGKRTTALAQDMFAANTGLLIEAAQLEIAHEDVGNVINDAIEEQAEWNAYRISKKKRAQLASQPAPAFDPETGCFFKPGAGDLDPLVTTVASEELARQAIARITKADSQPSAPTPSDTPMGRFFKNKYRVGSESLLQGVPRPLLLEILSTVLLVTRNSIMNVFGDRAAAIRSSAWYRFLSAFLWTFHGLAHYLRKGSEKAKSLMLALFLLAVSWMLAGIVWRGTLITSQGMLQWFLVFIFIPASILCAQGLYLVRHIKNE